MSRGRRVVATLSVVVATLTLTVSILATWVVRNVVDGGEFADRSVSLLDSAQVRRELAETITDELIAHGEGSLSSFRSTVVSLVEELTGTNAFKLVFRDAVEEAHDDIFERGANRASLDLSDTLDILSSVAAGADRGSSTPAAGPASATGTAASGSTATTSTTTGTAASGSTATTTPPATATTQPGGTTATPGGGSGSRPGDPLLDPALELLRRAPTVIRTLSVDEAPVLEHLRLWRTARDLRWLAVVAPLATVAAAAAALAVGRPRRQMVLELGVGVALAGLAVVVVCLVVPHLVADELRDPGLAAATRSAVERFLADLRTIGVWTVPVGVLVAAAATAGGAPHLGAHLREAWGAFGAGSSRGGTATRALRGLVLVLAGVAAIAYRETVLPVAVGLAGAAIAYTGVVLVLDALLGPAPAGRHRIRRPAGGAGGGAPRRRSRTAVAVAAGVGATLVVGVGLVAGMTRARDDARQGAAHLAGCNGFVELCDRRLDQVAFAGSHNSMSAADSSGWLFAENLHGIASQLDYGIRALLVKSHYGIPTGVSTDGAEVVVTDETAEAVGNPVDKTEELPEAAIAQAEQLERTRPETPVPRSLYLCHVHCALGSTKLSGTLDQIRHFLEANPREVIILFIGDFVSPEDTAGAFAAAGLAERVWTYDTTVPPPTLRQMIDARRNLFVLSEHAGGTPAWYTKGYGVFQDTPYTFTDPKDFSCAVNRGPADAPLFEINHWITNKEPPSLEQARTVNSYDVLLGRVRQCQAERKLFPTIVAVNFAEQGDLLRVVDTVNGTPGRPT